MSVRLVVDGGATSLRMGQLEDTPDGPKLAKQVEVTGFQWSADVDPVQTQCDRIDDAWQQLGSPAPIDVAAFGLAGGSADPAGRSTLAPAVAKRLGARTVLLTSDDVTTHLGALGGAPGVVITVGTGTNCLAVSPDGELVNADGIGYLFGDAGSGFAIGRAGARAAFAALDGRGPATELTAAAEEHFGAPLGLTMRRAYRSNRLVANVAAFATAVAAAAPSDTVAAQICHDAGRDLAITVSAAIGRGFPDPGIASVPVSWAGSVLKSPVVFDAFSTALTGMCPQAVMREPLGGSLSGAVRLASGEQVPHLAGVAVAHA
jgi:glucosamine kinase